MKNKKILVGLLIGFIVLALGGYVVYNRVLDNQKLDDVVNNDDAINDISMFPKESKGIVLGSYVFNLLFDGTDNWLFDVSKNFQNIENVVNGVNYSLSCYEYDEEVKLCNIVKIRINEFNYDFYLNYGENGCSDDSYIIVTGDYLIEQKLSGCGDGGKLNVYNKYGDVVFSDDNSVYLYEDKNLKMVAVDNILYYVTYDVNSADRSNYYNLYFKYLDLNNMNKNVIQEFKGRVAGLND